MNKYAKAVLAALGAMVAAIEVQTPATSNQWIQVAASGVGVGLLTWYVPNTTNEAVIPPATVVPPKV